MSTAGDANTTVVQAITPKIPPFGAADIELWLAQIQLQFQIARISKSETKFSYIVAALPTEVISDLRDLILSPPTENPYEQICEALIARNSQTQRQKVHQLLHGEILGDRRPSQLLRSMKSLVGTTQGDTTVVSELFLQRLPTNVQQILVASPSLDLNEKALLADKLMEVQPNTISHVNPSTNTNQHNECIREITSLQQQVGQLMS